MKLPFLTKLLIGLALWTIATQVHAQLWSNQLKPTSGAGACTFGAISAANQCAIDWTSVGLPGGIPSSWTQCTTGACATANSAGTSATVAQLNAALTACSAAGNEYVLLATGTYTINGTVTVKNNCYLAGAGPQKTILNLTSSGAHIELGSYNDGPYKNGSCTITGGNTAGSSTLTLSANGLDSNPCSGGSGVGGYLVISELNDPVYVQSSSPQNPGGCGYCDGIWSGTRLREQIVEMTSFSGAGPYIVGISPPLYTNYGTATGTSPAYATPMGAVNGGVPDCKWCGVENLQIYANGYSLSAGTPDLDMSLCAYCWVHNVEFNYTDADWIDMDWCYRCQVDNNYFFNAFGHGAGGSDADVSPRLETSASLIVNNIFERGHGHLIVDEGAAGNVIAYNYLTGSVDAVGIGANQIDIAEHGAFPQFNLFEGNVGPNWQPDSWHGNEGYNTVFRNWWRGTNLVAPYAAQQIDHGTCSGTCTITWTSGTSNFYTGTYIILFGTNQSSCGNGSITYTGSAVFQLTGTPGAKSSTFSAGGCISWTGGYATTNDILSNPTPITHLPLDFTTNTYNTWQTMWDITIPAFGIQTNLLGNVLGSAQQTATAGTIYNSGSGTCTSCIRASTSRSYNPPTNGYASTYNYDTSGDSSGSIWATFPGGPSAVNGYWSNQGFITTCYSSNYDSASSSTINSVNCSPSLTLPPSFYLTSAPSWWSTAYGTPPWPAIGPAVGGGPDATVGNHANYIPAELCYNGLSRDATGAKLFDANACYRASSGNVPILTVAGSFKLGGALQVSIPATLPAIHAYTGVDLVPIPAPPNVGGFINNGATVYDTSFLGHTNWDGSTFSNSAYLSPITRLTDSTAANPIDAAMVTAGMGGAGYFTLTNTNTSLVSFVVAGGAQALCRFNTATGFCSTGGWGGAYAPNGIFISTGQNGTCSLAQSQSSYGCPVADFGSVFFSRVNPNLIYVFGSTLNGVTSSTGLTNHKAVTPITVNPSTGVYSFGSAIVDFDYGLPLGNNGTGGCAATAGPEMNAPCWAPSTSYAYGAYVTHPLSTSPCEMSSYGTGCGVWKSNQSYVAGDIVNNNGSATTCMYKVTTAGTSSSSVPSFLTSACKGDILTDGGVKWTGTASMAQFLYQDVTAGTHTSGSAFQWIATPATLAADGAMTINSAAVSSASNPFTAAMVGQAVSVSGAGNAGGTISLYTTILSYQSAGQVTLAIPALKTVSGSTISLTGHPDLMSSTVGDANTLVWVNVGPSVLNTSTGGSSGWTDNAGLSADASYSGNPTYYAIETTTNTYGVAPKYNSSGYQDTGLWAVDYDAGRNIYHLLNTGTGIWTDWSCSGGSGYNCAGGSWTATTVGALNAIANPYGTGQACPQLMHGSYGFSRNGLYHQLVASPTNFYPACLMTEYMVWQTTTANYNAYSSLQYTAFGTAHAAMGTNYMFSQSNNAWPNGYNAGIFSGIYDLRNAQGDCTLPGYTGCGNPVLTAQPYPAPFSVFLYPLASQGTAQTIPPGCYVDVGNTHKTPDCNIGDILGSHMSWAGDPGTDTYPACGTLYSEFTTNAWQNMEACMTTTPTYPAGYTPVSGGVSLSSQASVGTVWQFAHSFNTSTSTNFSTQYGVSEYSQDARWLFWTSDWGCTLGSKTGSGPIVWSTGTYYQMLQVAWADPFTHSVGTPGSLCGWQWFGATSYVAGNTINPIEGLTGTNTIDDVFQALTTGTSGPTTGAGTTSVNPKCGAVSCFSITNPPSATVVTVTAASEASTTGTFTVGTGIQLNDGQFVTLVGFTPSGWNGTYAVTGTVGAGCPGASCAAVTSFQLAGMTAGLGTVTIMGTAASQGDTVCDLTTPGSDSLDPVPPYSSSCSPGVVWQDLGPQNQRGDVFAVKLRF